MTGAESQLAEVRRELQEARARVHQVAADAGDRHWSTRPAPDRWSVAECLIHLNASSTAFLPRIRAVLDEGHRAGLSGHGPFRLDFWGWMLCRMLEPPARMKAKTSPPFEPVSIEPPAKVVADFDRLQGLLVQCVEASDGLPIQKLKVSSPFAKHIKYSLYSAYRVIPAHQRRHLWQAERVLAALA